MNPNRDNLVPWSSNDGDGDGTPLDKMMVPNSHGAIWIDEFARTYWMDEKAAAILDVAREGSADAAWVADLLSKLDAAGQQKNCVNFRNHQGHICRARWVPAPSGQCVLLVDNLRDITTRVFELKANEREYRELFENASYGVYKATFDGQPLRANPALRRLHGFDSEEEFLEASKGGADCYVLRGRRDQFFEELHSTGKVSDFVSEFKRLKTGERFWISETAWLVTDASGQPRYFAGTVVDVSDRIRTLETLRKAAETDALTRLANRNAFNAELDRMVHAAGCGSVSVFLVDIDRFKDVNDIYGHHRGDAVLRICAERLSEALPSDGLLARLGGDEFAYMSRSTTSDDDLRDLASRIVNAFAAPIESGGSSHLLGASVGVARFPEHADCAQVLMRNADLALYSVKDSGRGHARIFDVELDLLKRSRHRLEQELRGAHLRGEFELHYQPVFDCKSERIAGVEALLRWNHPERGRVPPAEFIPIAENAGLMLDLGSWVLNEVCRHAVALPPRVRVAVNVSSLQFRSFDLPSVLAAALAEHKLEANRLELEVTESVVLKNEAATFAVLNELRALGVRIALDDFGTGYSSLSYLQRFPFDKVKIDRSFVRSIKTDTVNRAVTRAVLSIGRDLGIEVVAEGIETEQERQTLLNEGCSLMQGFLYGQPVPLAEISRLIGLDTLRSVDLDNRAAVAQLLSRSA